MRVQKVQMYLNVLLYPRGAKSAEIGVQKVHTPIGVYQMYPLRAGVPFTEFNILNKSGYFRNGKNIGQKGGQD